MLNKTAFFCVAATLVVSLSCAAGEGKAGKEGKGLAERGGPIAHILDHAKELNLTPEQKTKLEALQKEMQAEIAGKIGGGDFKEKLKEHPELLKEMKAAKESGDEGKMKALREKIREHMAKNGGGADGEKAGQFRVKVAEILNPDQMKQVKELMEDARAKNGGLAKGEKAEPGQKPDTSKAAPKVFE